MADFQKVKSAFKIKSIQGDVCKAMCPAHPDKEASLSIKYDKQNDNVIFKCFAGCETKEIIDAAGLQWSDIFGKELSKDTNSNGWEILAVYKYLDDDGKLRFEKIRYKTKEKPKNFSQRRYVDGATVWKLDAGIYFETFPGSNEWSMRERYGAAKREFEKCEPVLYNLPELMKAVSDGKEVFIVEGEKDVENLKKWGLVATCNFDGASESTKKPKWKKEYNHYFKGAKVIVLADNDDPGRSHAEYIASNLQGIAEYVKCPEFTGLQEKGDVSDWIELGNTREILAELIDNTDIWDAEINLRDSLIKFNFSDVGNAERLICMYNNNIRYSPIRKKWMIWSGKYWETDHSGNIENLCRKVIRKLQADGTQLPDKQNGTDNTKLKEQVCKFVLRSESDSRIKAMVNQAKTHSKLILKDTDQNPYKLNLLNGTLNLKTGLIEKHNKKDYITKIVNIEYNPKAECPNWIEFINRIFLGRKDLINYIQKSIGYSMTGDADLQCFYICHGQGSNGKGTFMKAIMMILGDYAGVLKGNSLMEKMGDEGARGDLAKLEGKHFVCVNELEENKSFDESLVKSLTSGADEVVPVRRMYEEEFDLRPTFKMWMTTNKLPKIKGTDDGIWRRIRKIPFEYSFEKQGNKNEHFFEEVLLPEISGILNWAIQGCLKWQQEGMEVPDIVKYAIDDYRNDMDPIQRFMDEECIVSETCKVSVTQIYEEYCEWCKANKEYTLSQIKLSKKFAEKNFTKTKIGRVWYWKGIGITDASYQVDVESELTPEKDNITPFWGNK